MRQLYRMWIGRVVDAWNHTAQIAAAMTSEPPNKFHPFPDTGRRSDPEKIPYDPDLMRQIVNSGKLGW